MKQNLAFKKIGVFLLVLASIVGVFVACTESISRDRFDTRLIDIYASGRHFQIPRNYLLSWDDNLKEDFSAEINVLWPGFESWDDSNAELFHEKSKRMIRIILRKNFNSKLLRDLSCSSNKMPNPGCDARAIIDKNINIYVNINAIYKDDYQSIIKQAEQFLLQHEVK